MDDRSKIIRDSDDFAASFLRLSGQPLRSGVEVEPFARAGVDGLGFIKVGRRGRPFTLVGFRDFDDMTAASNSVTELIDSLKGEPCTIVDSSGVEHADMICLDVRGREPRPVLLGVGGLSGSFGAVVEVEMDFVCRK